MEHTNLSGSNLVADKLNVNVYILHVMVMDMVTCNIDETNIVRVDSGC